VTVFVLCLNKVMPKETLNIAELAKWKKYVSGQVLHNFLSEINLSFFVIKVFKVRIAKYFFVFWVPFTFFFYNFCPSSFFSSNLPFVSISFLFLAPLILFNLLSTFYDLENNIWFSASYNFFYFTSKIFICKLYSFWCSW
jgi:hypothetical protein